VEAEDIFLENMGQTNLVPVVLAVVVEVLKTLTTGWAVRVDPLGSRLINIHQAGPNTAVAAVVVLLEIPDPVVVDQAYVLSDTQVLKFYKVVQSPLQAVIHIIHLILVES
jgi:hypothetical protein